MAGMLRARLSSGTIFLLTFSQLFSWITCVSTSPIVCPISDDYVEQNREPYYAIERGALCTLYSATNGSQWNNSSNWLKNIDHCNWNGVTCSFGKVVSLILKSNNLRGYIPPILTNLTNLSALDLSLNNLSGEIPSSLFESLNFSKLILRNNSLSGILPKCLSKMTNLVTLDLRYNSLTGTLPILQNMTNLQYVGVTGNKFSRVSDMINLPNLKTFRLQHNNLSGAPPRLINLPSLRELMMDNNSFSSDLTNFWQDFMKTSLNEVNLSYNNFTSLSDFQSSSSPCGQYNKTKLKLNLTRNSISETKIPDFFFRCFDSIILSSNPQIKASVSNIPENTPLTQLLVIDTGLYGSLSSTVLRKLTRVMISYTSIQISLSDINNNIITALVADNVPGLSKQEIPPSVNTWTDVETISLGFNSMTGTVSDFTNLRKLKHLDLRDNMISGDLPPTFASQQLTYLRFLGNRITGTISPTLFNDGSKNKLEYINLSGNNIKGDIYYPTFENMTHLQQLYLDNNAISQLNSTVLRSLLSLQKLRRLSFHNNEISNTDLFNIDVTSILSTSNMAFITAYNNHIGGRVGKEFVSLPKLKSLFIHNNLLSCDLPAIPTSLDSNKSLLVLGNQFELPDSKISYIEGTEEPYLFVSDRILLHFLLKRVLPFSIMVLVCLLMLTTRYGWRLTWRIVNILYHNGLPTIMNVVGSDRNNPSDFNHTSGANSILCEPRRQFSIFQIQAIVYLSVELVLCMLGPGIMAMISNTIFECSPFWMRFTVASSALTEGRGWAVACLFVLFVLCTLFFLVRTSSQLLELNKDDSDDRHVSDSVMTKSEPSSRNSSIRRLCGTGLTGICLLGVSSLSAFYVCLLNLPYDNVLLKNIKIDFISQEIYLQDVIIALIPPIISLLDIIFIAKFSLYIIRVVEAVDRRHQASELFIKIFVIRLFSSLLAPLAIVCVIDTGCWSLYRSLWNPCHNGMFNILDIDSTAVEQEFAMTSEQICNIGFRYGFCSRRVIQLCGFLQFKIFCYNMMFTPLITLLKYNLFVIRMWSQAKTFFPRLFDRCRDRCNSNSKKNTPTLAMDVDVKSLQLPLLNNSFGSVDDTTTASHSSSSSYDHHVTPPSIPPAVADLSVVHQYVDFIVTITLAATYSFFYPLVLFPVILYLMSSLLINIYVRVSCHTLATHNNDTKETHHERMYVELLPVNIAATDRDDSECNNDITEDSNNPVDCTQDDSNMHVNTKNTHTSGNSQSSHVSSSHCCATAPGLPYLSSYGLLFDFHDETFQANFTPSPSYLLVGFLLFPVMASLFFLENNISGKWLVISASLLYVLCCCAWLLRHIYTKRNSCH